MKESGRPPLDLAAGRPSGEPVSVVGILLHLEQTAWPVDPSGAPSYGSRRGALWCQGCLLLADDPARDWRLLRVDVPGEDDEPLLAAYGPECAAREFGHSRRIDSGKTEAQ
jgi:hypothetical protein